MLDIFKFKKLFFLFSFFILFLPTKARAEDLWKTQEVLNIVKPVAGEAFVAGQEINVTKKIDGDLIALAQRLVISAPINQDVRAAAEEILINSTIFGNATIFASKITISKSADIKGTLRVWANSLEIQDSVSGTVIFNNDKVDGQGQYYQKSKEILEFNKINWFWQLVAFFSSLLIGLIIINLFPSSTKKIMLQIIETPGKVLLAGLVFVLVMPLAAFLLLITLIGIPLGLIILGAYFFLLYIALIFPSLILGKVIIAQFVKSKSKINKIAPTWFLTVGLLVMRLVFLIPQFGAIIKFLAVLLGFGGVLFCLKQQIVKSKSVG